MKKRKLADGIYWIEFPTQKALTETFVRPQEYYESPDDAIRGQSFSLETFKKVYTKRTGLTKFTYYSDWWGFNLPGTVLEDFAAGKIGKLSVKEAALVKKFKPLFGTTFYVIATVKGDAGTLAHELAHAMWCLCPEYRIKVQRLLRLNGPLLRPLYRALVSHYYWAGVLQDEANAYLTHDKATVESWGIDIKRYATLIARLQELYTIYFKKLKIKVSKK